MSAAAIRVPGIFWGLPEELHPDEPVVIGGAIGLIRRNSFNPTAYARPDHLEIKLDSIVYRIYAFFAGGRADEMYRQDQAVFIALARSMTVLFAVAAVALAFLIARRFGGWSGLIAAFLFACFPPFVANSSLATPDMPLTCLLTAVVWCCVRYLERPSWRNLSGACAFTALAVAVKYPGALGAIPIVAVVVVVLVRSGDRRRGVQHLLLAPVAFVIALFITSPTLITRFYSVQRQLVAQSGSGHLGASGLGYPGRAWFYVQYLSGWMGVLLVAAALFGLYRCVRIREVKTVPLFVGVPFWLAVCALGLHWYRWSLPIAITPLLLAAIGASAVIEQTAALRTPGRPRARAISACLVALLVVCAGWQAIGSAATVATLTAPDTRIVAEAELAARAIDSDNTVFDGYTPFKLIGPSTIAHQVRLEDGVLVSEKRGARYVMISSYMYDRIYAGAPPEKIALYRAVEELPLVAQWVPADGPAFNGLAPLSPWGAGDLLKRYLSGAWSGPTIKVYALGVSGRGTG